MVDDWMDIERCAQLCNTTALSEEEDDELGREEQEHFSVLFFYYCLSLAWLKVPVGIGVGRTRRGLARILARWVTAYNSA